MKKNSRSSVALHSLVSLVKADRPLTSEELGECQNTNPVIIRKVLGELKKKGIVSSEKGHGGGWVVLKSPKEISFHDIFQALNESLLPPGISLDKDEHCLIMKSVAETMDDFLIDAKILLEKKFKKILLQDIVDGIKTHRFY